MTAMGSIPPFAVEIDGQTYFAEPALVVGSHIGENDHGIWTHAVEFRGSGWGQNLMEPALGEYSKATKEQIGTAFGMDFIMEVIRQIGSPEQSAGKQVLVFRKVQFDQIVGFVALAKDGSYGKPFMVNALRHRYFPEIASA